MRRALKRRILGGRPRAPWVAPVAVIALLSLGASRAQAQLCHDLPDLESRHAAHHDHPSIGGEVGFRLEAATAAIQRRPIDYQGTSLRVDVHRGAFHLRGQASWYRVRDSLEVTNGPGDLLLAAMWTAYQTHRVRFGLALPVGIPTGSDVDHLGMGHWMIMPGVFGAAQLSPGTSASVGVSYNRALGNHGGHNHGIGPYVNPMTAEELGVAARLALRTGPALQIVTETAIAAPFDGSARMILGAGFTVQRHAISLSVLAQAGALYAPFTARGVAEASFAF